jgi:mono/diheme cytochrome c family protein
MTASFSAPRFATIACLAAAGATLALAVSTRSSAQGTAAPAVPFTTAQATHGKTVFDQQCAGCHGAKLEGGGGPALAGASFQSSWKGRSVADLNDQIAQTMPLSDPGSVTGKDLTDVVSYILSAQGVPAGNTELPAAHDAQAKLKIPAR